MGGGCEDWYKFDPEALFRINHSTQVIAHPTFTAEDLIAFVPAGRLGRVEFREPRAEGVGFAGELSDGKTHSVLFRAAVDDNRIAQQCHRLPNGHQGIKAEDSSCGFRNRPG